MVPCYFVTFDAIEAAKKMLVGRGFLPLSMSYLRVECGLGHEVVCPALALCQEDDRPNGPIHHVIFERECGLNGKGEIKLFLIMGKPQGEQDEDEVPVVPDFEGWETLTFESTRYGVGDSK